MLYRPPREPRPVASGPYKDFVYIALGVGALFGALYLYTGVWPPVVVVETNSMMHVDPGEYQQHHGTGMAEHVGFGRLGTLDPGDLTLIEEVDSVNDVTTFARSDEHSYGKPGDVIAYEATLNERPVIILHRALTYVDAQETDDGVRYVVDWTSEWEEPDDADCTQTPVYRCTFSSGGITIQEEGTFNVQVTRSGFLTKGDNAATNPGIDQAPPDPGTSPLKPRPVIVDEIQGKALGEVPSIGLVKLTVSGSIVLNAEMQDHPYFLRIGNMVAPVDLWLIAGAQVITLSIAPFISTVTRSAWNARNVERAPEVSVLQDAYNEKHPRPPQQEP